MSAVTRLIAAWERLDAAALVDCFTEDAVWHNMPFAPISGRAAVVGAITRFLADVEHAEFRVHHAGEIAPGIVMTERNDVFRLKSGKIMDIPVMGVFEIADDRVRAWRDYFDAGTMNV